MVSFRRVLGYLVAAAMVVALALTVMMSFNGGAFNGEAVGSMPQQQQHRKLLQFPGFPNGGGGGGFNPPNPPSTENPSTGTHSHTKCKHHCKKGLPGPSK